MLHVERPLLRWTALAGVLLALLSAACAPRSAPAPGPAPAAPTTPPAGTAAPSAQASFDERAVANFYRGKTVQVVVSTAAGGGFDLYSRAIARHLSKYIPGNPTIIVDNRPGAGHMIGMNYVYNAARKDGTVIGNASGGLAMNQLFGLPGVEFDMTKLHYLGLPTPDTMVMLVSRESGIRSLDDLLGPNARQAVLGGTGPGSLQGDFPLLLRDGLGANVRLVSGYQGTNLMKIAMEQGEIHGYFNSWESVKSTDRDKVESGEWLLLAQFTDAPHRELPRVPGVLGFAKNDEQRQLLRYGGVLRSFVRPYFLPPGVPLERVQALQAAFMQTMADPEFLADAAKANLDIDPLPGQEVSRYFTEFLTMPPDVKDKLQRILQVEG